MTTLMMLILPDFMNRFFEMLAKPLIKILPIIDVETGWAIIHGLAGFIIMYFILKFNDDDKPFLTLILLLLVFEAFEFLISYPIGIILKESFLNFFWDIIIGVVGGLIAWFIWRKK